MAIQPPDDHPILRVLSPDEQVQALAKAGDADIVVTDRRLAVHATDRLTLDIELGALRRIQFDIERTRPATLVVVPEHASHEPQVLAVMLRDHDEGRRSRLAPAGRGGHEGARPRGPGSGRTSGPEGSRSDAAEGTLGRRSSQRHRTLPSATLQAHC